MNVVDLTFPALAKAVSETRLALSHLFPRAPESAMRRCFVVVWPCRKRVANESLIRVLHWTVDGIMENWVPRKLLPLRISAWEGEGWTRLEVGREP